MKITDLNLTLFAWDGIPPTQYGRHTGRFSGQSQLGLLTLRTDDGVQGNSLNNVANLNLIMAVRNCEFFEVLLPAAAQKYGLVEDIEVDAQGLVHAPTAPGLGARIDFDLIARRKTATL